MSGIALTVAWTDIRTGSRWTARRWLHLVALTLLVLGCLAKGVVVAKAAYLQGMASERAIALVQPVSDAPSDTYGERGKGSKATCVSATHLAPLSCCESLVATLREAAIIHILPLYPEPPGWSAQPPDRPPRRPA